MRRFLLLLIAAMTVFSLVACGGGGDSSSSDSDPNKPPLDIESEAKAIIEDYSISGGDYFSSAAESDDGKLNDDLIRSFFGDVASVPDFSSVEAYAVYIDESRPLDPCEFGIFKMAEGADSEEFMKYLKARVDTKIETAKAYPTMDKAALTTAEYGIQNGYIWYLVVKGGNAEIHEKLTEKA